MEEELKRDHAEMQAVIDAKQKIIDAQVRQGQITTRTLVCSFCVLCSILFMYNSESLAMRIKPVTCGLVQ